MVCGWRSEDKFGYRSATGLLFNSTHEMLFRPGDCGHSLVSVSHLSTSSLQIQSMLALHLTFCEYLGCEAGPHTLGNSRLENTKSKMSGMLNTGPGGDKGLLVA